jgi:dTDP-4-amino-4,6-dideoxygalactose transaminase
MGRTPRPFKSPIYVTRPMLPPLDEYVNQLREVWESRWLTNVGGKHIALEKALAAFFGNKNISLFNNGTIAMMTACQALRLTGEVITTPFTFPATPHVLSWNKITPVFADIDPVTMTLDPQNIEPLITSRTSGILAVHVYGMPCDVAGIQTVADRQGLRVVYDAAHAFGTRIDGKLVTDFGDASMLSFHATKLFHTAEGGALLVRDPLVKERVDFLKNFGIKDEVTVLMPGINGKMNELQAALGLLVLKMVSHEREKRRVIAEIYKNRLNAVPGLTVPMNNNDVEYSYQYMPIFVDVKKTGRSRDELIENLRQYNIYARRYFYPLCSDYSCYRMLPSAHPSYLPVAHRVASQVVCLPFYGGLENDDIQRICDIIQWLIPS